MTVRRRKKFNLFVKPGKDNVVQAIKPGLDNEKSKRGSAKKQQSFPKKQVKEKKAPQNSTHREACIDLLLWHSMLPGELFIDVTETAVVLELRELKAACVRCAKAEKLSPQGCVPSRRAQVSQR